MGIASRLAIFVCFLMVGIGTSASSAEIPATLSAEDKTFLDGLMKEFLFDPKGAEFVLVKMLVQIDLETEREEQVPGWLVIGAEKKPARICFADRNSIEAPPSSKLEKVDFATFGKARLGAIVKSWEDIGKYTSEMLKGMTQTSAGFLCEDPLVYAAWLYRRGDEGLAARMLAQARKRPIRFPADKKHDAYDVLRERLSWAAYASVAEDFARCKDEQAMSHAERLLRLYPGEAKAMYPQVSLIVEDLKRRKKKGSFGVKASKELPTDFDKWETKKQVSYLVDSLDEIVPLIRNANWALPHNDARYRKLVRLGEAMIPTLFELAEKDKRLTRTVTFDPHASSHLSYRVYPVGQAAHEIARDILKVSDFEPNSPEDEKPATSSDWRSVELKKLRAYWAEYGKLPFDERMMKILTDSKANTSAKREAAVLLATMVSKRDLLGNDRYRAYEIRREHKPNPAAKKFRMPSPGEAILAMMDVELREFKADRPADAEFNTDFYEARQNLESLYLASLWDLGDRTIVAELAIRASTAKSIHQRAVWAQAAFHLGNTKPLEALAEDLRLGRLKLPAKALKSEEDSKALEADYELGEVIRVLVSADSPAADRALYAVANPMHPQHDPIARHIRFRDVRFFDTDFWFEHPYCLAFLRRLLEDKTPTDGEYSIESGHIHLQGESSDRFYPTPKQLSDPAAVKETAKERICDYAALKMQELVFGLPFYHPLQKVADKRLKEFIAADERFGGKFQKNRGTNRGLFFRSFKF